MEVGPNGVCETGLWTLGLAFSGLRLCLTIGMLCGFAKLAILGSNQNTFSGFADRQQICFKY
ncbi:MAG: hypothetical protein ACKESC_01500 [Candidatus Hodgkinia cicadicola]